jgi:hypothetical protein
MKEEELEEEGKREGGEEGKEEERERNISLQKTTIPKPS